MEVGTIDPILHYLRILLAPGRVVIVLLALVLLSSDAYRIPLGPILRYGLSHHLIRRFVGLVTNSRL